MHTATFAAVFAALLTAHWIADHWVQTDHQATHKGDRDRAGQWACARHVATYTATTALAVAALWSLADDLRITATGFAAGQLWSAITHYLIDRRWTLAVLADLAGKAAFHDRGRPRHYTVQALHTVLVPTSSGQYHPELQTDMVPIDAPPAFTGAYPLDQALHLACLFVSALLTALI